MGCRSLRRRDERRQRALPSKEPTIMPTRKHSAPALLSWRSALRAGGLTMAASLAAAPHERAVAQAPGLDLAPNQDGLSADIIEIFQSLPGTKGLKLWAPPEAGRPAWQATLNAEQEFFIASAFKAFVLAAYLLQAEDDLDPADAAPLRDQLSARLAEELTLDEEVFSTSSLVFNPPHLRGKVSARTVLEAMIAQSDNTATDMALRRLGPDRVRQFIASLGLANTRIPESTRQFFGWVYGDPEWQTLTWPRLLDLTKEDPYPHRPTLNDEITMTTTADELVAFYSHVFQGGLFRYPETLARFRAFLAQANTIALSMPLGVNAFAKSGWAGARPHGATLDGVLAMAGAVFARSRWVYFALIVNWPASAGILPDVEPAFFTATNAIFTLVRDRLG
jgi:beta-lactamase class A